MGERAKFAGGDQAYLRDEQYRDASKLASRAKLHELYSTSEISWFDWVGHRLELEPSIAVLEAGCGTGWLWDETAVEIPADVSIVLTDLSQGMVNEAVDRVRSTDRLSNVDGQPADLQDLPFESQTFDRVVANHMLYHLPDPAGGVAELARVVRPDGVVIAATNGRRHMAELWQIRAEVFAIEAVDETVGVFGAETGFPILRDHFGDVRWLQFHDSLEVTEPQHALDYLCSSPPGETATDEEMERLRAAIDAAFTRGGGVMTITKDSGAFICRAP